MEKLVSAKLCRRTLETCSKSSCALRYLVNNILSMDDYQVDFDHTLLHTDDDGNKFYNSCIITPPQSESRCIAVGDTIEVKLEVCAHDCWILAFLYALLYDLFYVYCRTDALDSVKSLLCLKILRSTQ